MKRVCVIGCGVICENHLTPLSLMNDIKIEAVCDIIPERANNKADKYGCKAYADCKKMIEEIKPDSVHICLPHYLHSPVAVYCMEHGVDVLCEKPMNASYEGAVLMKETAEKTGKKLGIIFQNRYNSGSVLAKNTVKSGKLGKVVSITGLVMWHRDEAYYESGTWRKDYATAGGGVIINQAIHTLDMIRWLADSDVKSVKATVSHHGDTSAEVEDTTEGIISFENGARGLFYFTINNFTDENIVVKVHCENGDISIAGGRCKIKYKDGTEEEDHPNSETFCGAKAVYGSSHAIQIAEFYDENSADKVKKTVDEALKTQKLIYDIFASSGNPKN